MRLRPLRLMVGGALLALGTMACSAVDDTDASASDLVDGKACPDGLIDVVRHDGDWHLFSPRVAEACLAGDAKPAANAKDLETYLAKSPLDFLNKKPDFLATCMASYESRTGASLTEDQKRAVVGNYYYLMNSLKEDALSTLQSLAGVNTLLGAPSALPEVKGFSYSHPYIDESQDWERRLATKCHNDPSQLETLVQFTNGVLWQVRKISAAIHEAQSEAAYYPPNDSSPAGEARTKRIEGMIAQRDVLVKSIAPWLNGKEMAFLIDSERSLAEMIRLENRFNLVDETGMMRLKGFWNDGQNLENPMLAQENAVRAAFPKQLAATRDTLMKHLTDLQHAADFLHDNEDGKISESDYQGILGHVIPFDPNVFSTYFASDEFKHFFSEEKVSALETDVRGALPSGASWPEATDITQRLLRIEVALQELGAGADPALAARAEELRQSYDDKTKGLAANAELAEAKCRNEKRSKFQGQNELGTQLSIAAGLTVVTFGMGWWLSAARVALVLEDSALVGAQWAEAARVNVLAARGAMGLARTGVSYQNQARLLWGVLLGANGYFTVEGTVSTIAACNEAINDNMLKVFDQPFDVSAPACIQGKQALSNEAVANYKACAVNVVMVGALTLISVYAGAADLRHGPLAAR